MSYYRDQLEEWLKRIDVKGKKVLDVGGSSLPVKGRTRSWEVEEYFILDNSLERQLIGGFEDPHFPYDIQDREKIIEIKERYGHEFDLIFCLEVFEYVYQPLEALRNIHDLLIEGGAAYISFPFVYPQHNPSDSDYLRYTPTGVRKLVQEAGFSNAFYQNRWDKSGLLQKFYRADGMHPAKDRNHDIYGVMVTAIK